VLLAQMVMLAARELPIARMATELPVCQCESVQRDGAALGRCPATALSRVPNTHRRR
jgi:hypothetical protein